MLSILLLSAVLAAPVQHSDIEIVAEYIHGIVSYIQPIRGCTRQPTDKEILLTAESFLAVAQKYNLPLELLLGIAQTESLFFPCALSATGDGGIMQLSPPTRQELLKKLGFSPKKHVDIPLNIELGAYYLAYLIEKFGNTEDAIRAYNVGPYNLKKLPKTANEYLYKVQVHINMFRCWDDTLFNWSSLRRQKLVCSELYPTKPPVDPSFHRLRKTKTRNNLCAGPNLANHVTKGKQQTINNREYRDKLHISQPCQKSIQQGLFHSTNSSDRTSLSTTKASPSSSYVI